MFNAFGWPDDLSNQAVLAKLLVLSLEPSGAWGSHIRLCGILSSDELIIDVLASRQPLASC